jgi:hypothetical protein
MTLSPEARPEVHPQSEANPPYRASGHGIRGVMTAAVREHFIVRT